TFDQWIDGTLIEQRFEDLRSVLLVAAFVDSLPHSLAVMIRDENPKTLEEAMDLAKTYDESRNFCFSREAVRQFNSPRKNPFQSHNRQVNYTSSYQKPHREFGSPYNVRKNSRPNVSLP